MVDTINDYVMLLIHVEERIYLNLDNICKEDGEIDLDYAVFSVKNLNTIKC